MAFRPVQLNQTVDPKLTGTIQYDPNAVAPSGFTPLDPVAASRVKAALTLEQQLAEGRAGQFPPTSQPFAAFARGALNSALAGTTEAAGSLSGSNPQYDPNSPLYTNPYSGYAGEMVGNLIPLGRIKGAATGLANFVKEGARIGGIYGAGQGVSEAAQSENPTVAGALESGATGGATGAALGGAIPLVTGAAVKMIPTKQNILDDLLKISSADEGKLKRSASGGYVQAADKVTPFLKKGDDVPKFIEATEKALDQEADKFKPIVEAANPSYLNPDSLYQQADAELAKLVPNPDTRKELLLNSGDFLSDILQINPKNLLQYASKANREVGRIYKNPSSPITTEGLAALESVRDVYGNTIRRILEDAGQDPSVYSGYGAIKEMGNSIGKNYLKEAYKLSAQKGRSPLGNIMTGLKTGGSGFNIAEALQGPLAPITEGEKGRLDRQISSLVENFIGYGREKTDKAKADKLDKALRFINTVNKNNAEPLTEAEIIGNSLYPR